MPLLDVYDIETYPDIFSYVGVDVYTNNVVVFEVSPRKNDIVGFLNHMTLLASDPKSFQVGYNNVGFDYPVIHHLMTYPGIESADWQFICDLVMQKSNAIFDSEDRFSQLVKPWEVLIPQIDLYKVHHFDNMARATSLKMLMFNMRCDNIQDLPYQPRKPVGAEGYQPLMDYNVNDTQKTVQFLMHSQKAISFRKEIDATLSKNPMNMSDVKIGGQIFIDALEAAKPGTCFANKKPRQTHRKQIALNDVILPYIKFDHPVFQRQLETFKSKVIKETKGVFEDMVCRVDEFDYVFGAGGIHGSIDPESVFEDEDFTIIDWDVTSYYPSLSIKNNFYPQHLGELFCKIYQDLFNERKKYPKSDPRNGAYKLALNGTYGASNSKYSPFYDPQFTMSITINGQLLLCLLAEKLSTIPWCRMLQINTDGLTVRIPRMYIPHAEKLIEDWEQLTKLNMERADYSAMHIRDVNNYIAVGTDGNVKRKGTYCHSVDLGWHQNHSSQVVAMAAEANLLHGTPIKQFIEGHEDIFDFFKVTKVPRSSMLYHGDAPTQNICRYLITKSGKELTKKMPPLAKSESQDWREFAIDKGYKTTVHNDIRVLPTLKGVNYSYYIKEAKKLTECMK